MIARARIADGWFGALPEDVRKAVAANMTLLGAATSPRTPPVPEDHAPASSWIQAQDWEDGRKQLAHEELHKRVGLANRQRSAAEDAAKETGLALAQKLGPGFISVNQLPPAVRRDLSDDALAALTLRADRNVHPVTVAPHGDVATTLNRMAATDPEGFAREDLRLVRDRMTPGEYASLERTQKGLASYPPAPANITQRHLWDEIRRNGLDDDPARDAGTATPSLDEGQVDRLASVDTIPEALRGTDATKGVVREMLRTGWAPDQIQNQLYEVYVRRSMGQSGENFGGGSPALDSELDAYAGPQPVAMLQDGEPFAQDRIDGLGDTKRMAGDRQAALVPAKYSRVKNKPAPDQVPAWVKKHNESIWRSPIYLSSSRDEDAYKAVRRMGNPDGWTIVYTHGDPTQDGTVYDRHRGLPDLPMSAIKIFNDLRTQPGYDPKATILLTACYGANDTTASDLSKLTHGVVYVAKVMSLNLQLRIIYTG